MQKASMFVKVILVSLITCATTQDQAASATQGLTQPTFSPITREFIPVDFPVIVLQHVKIIDGTGAAAAEDQSIVIDNGVIRSVGASRSTPPPAGAHVMDLTGRSVMPGMVGMHEHMFYPGPTGRRGSLPAGVPALYPQMQFSFPRLYLGAGVTTIRTGGSMQPYADLELKRSIDAGVSPGPKMHLTAPYLQGPLDLSGPLLNNFAQLHTLTGPEDAVRLVNYWADEGFTSFKAYTQITRAELDAAIKAAHARNLKVTGHLCSVSFKEAADLGIDNVEHGFFADSEFTPDKEPDKCPLPARSRGVLESLDVHSARVQDALRYLVGHHLAITSTLPIPDSSVPNRPPLTQRFIDALSPLSLQDYLINRSNVSETGDLEGTRLKKEFELEYAFSKAGGMLVAGLDPTGNGGVVAGFGDQRELELLVEAGFTPSEAVQITTQNGAKLLGEESRIGTIQVGKQADLIVVNGDLTRQIRDIEKVELVFKDGKGYDSKKLIDSVKGLVGLR
jgi:imidazolonepropionase-like amidohydrolase